MSARLRIGLLTVKMCSGSQAPVDSQVTFFTSE